MEHIKQKLVEFQELTKIIQDFIKSAPKEKLRIRKKGHNYQYYIEKNNKRRYIIKKNIEIVKKIAQRDYYKKLLSCLEKNTRVLNYFIANYNPYKLEQCYQKLPEARRQLINPIILDNETFTEQWQAKKYERKKEAPDGSFCTLKNEAVRSKSEIIIANLLCSRNVPYHYEYPVHLAEGMIFHPDFLCLNKRTRQEFYWEHCGRMDDPVYAVNMTQKLSEYSKNGIIPGKNLILTFETVKTPVETKAVERLIEAFLL